MSSQEPFRMMVEAAQDLMEPFFTTEHGDSLCRLGLGELRKETRTMTLNEARVLLVDDEPEILEIFAKWLKRSGCMQVTTAADGLEALAALEAQPYDLVVTDVRMPRMDGVTLARQVRKMGMQIPSIIFVTGQQDVDTREMYGLGVECFLSKPIDFERLLEAITHSLASRWELWAIPMDTQPKQSIEIPDAIFGEGRDEGQIALGRGGFSARIAGSFSLETTSFCCGFAKEKSRELTGQGVVRWRSKDDKAVGVEFVYLDEGCRPWLIARIEAGYQGYIPAG